MKPLLPTLANVYSMLNQYKAQADQSIVPQDGVRPRRCGDAREELEIDEPINNESPVVQLADFLFFNLKSVLGEDSARLHELNSALRRIGECPRTAELFVKLQDALGNGRYHPVAYNKLVLVKDWGCSPFRLLDAALAALREDLLEIDASTIDFAKHALKNRTVIYANAAGAGGPAVLLNGFEHAGLRDMTSTAASGNYAVHSRLGTEKELEQDVFVIRQTLARTEEKLAKARGLNRDYFVLNRDIAAMEEMEELRAEKKRKVVEIGI